MANDELKFNDASSPVVPYTTHTKNKGTSTTTSLPIEQPQVGIDDGEFATFGTMSDVPASPDTWTTTGISYFRAFKAFWRDVFNLLTSLNTAASSTSPVTTTLTGSIPAGANAIGTVGLTGNLPGFATTPTINLGANAVTVKATGTLSANNDAVTVACDGMSTLFIRVVASTATGTAVFEATPDGTNWDAINFKVVGGAVAAGFTNGVNGAIQAFVTSNKAYLSVRVRATSTWSAPIAIEVNAGNAMHLVRVENPVSDPLTLGGVYNTTPPAPTAGQGVALQTDVSGNLKTVGTAQASELHLGEVGGNVVKALVTFGPASSTTYTTGQVLLASTSIANMARVANGTGYIFGASLALNALNTVQIDAFIFTTQPTGTYTAGATFTLTTADQAKLSKVLHIDDWTASGAASSFGQTTDKGPRLYKCEDGTATQTLWVILVARGSITLVTATDGNFSLRGARN